jgi:CubicO group peptidase (beta-lactamase class C family)
MTEWGIGGLALALVDGRDVAYAQGFGEARRDSIFRVGSISKLFNAVAVVREIEEGGLEIDEPIASQLLPVNPFPKAPPVTLRQLLCHRSGPRRANQPHGCPARWKNPLLKLGAQSCGTAPGGGRRKKL